MLEAPDAERAERTSPVRPRLLPLVVAVVVTIGGLALLPVPAPVPSEESLPNLDPLVLDVALPEELAESFMEAWVRGDGGAAAALLKPGAKFHGFEAEMLPALHEWYRAVGQEFIGRRCELEGRYRTVVTCDFWYSNKMTRSRGVEPLPGRHLVFVEDGAITGVIEVLNSVAYLGFFGFTEWLSINHPDDFDLMFRFSPNPTPNANYPILDPISLALWEQYSDEFARTGVSPAAGVRRHSIDSHGEQEGSDA